MSDAPLHHRYAPTAARNGDPSDGSSAENGLKEGDHDDEDDDLMEDDVDSSQLERSMRDRRRAKSLPAGGLYEDNNDGDGRNKRVKFADSMGMDLAIVKHFSALELPQIPTKVLSRFRSYPPRTASPSAMIGDLCDSFTAAGLLSTAPAPPPTPHLDRLVACFPNPVGEEDVERRLRRGRVALDHVAITQFDVRGHIRVLVDHAGEVGVRYTFNDWLSHVDAQALPFVPASSSSDQHPPPPRHYRLFSFTMYTPPFVAPGASAIHFALYLRAEHGGGEFWDNNDGENYTLRYHCAPPATASFVSAAFQPT